MKIENDFIDTTFKTFVESAQVLCLAADTNFITFYVNPFCRTVHNITLEQAVGKHIKDIIGEEGFNDNLEHYNKTLEGNIVEYHGSFTKLDGSIHHYKATYAPIYRDGVVAGITAVVLDITSEVEAENAIKREIEYLREIRTLRGILPICSFCKKIRNDKGYYEQIEDYIHKNSGVDFSHTICGDCLKKYYPEECEDQVLNKKSKD